MRRRNVRMASLACCLALLGVIKSVVAAPVDYKQLIEIIDLGVANDIAGSDDYAGLAIAPDGQYVAVQSRRASVAKDSVELRWLLVALDGSAQTVDVGSGGELIDDVWLGRVNGNSIPETPLWSNDSAWIVYRRKAHGAVELWRSDRHGKRQEQLTHSSGDVGEFRWSRDGRRLIYTVAASRIERASSKRDEAARGYLYDGRFNPVYARWPLELSDQTDVKEIHVYDFHAGQERVATTVDIAEFRESDRLAGRPAAQWIRRNAQTEATAWLEDLRDDKSIGLDQPLSILYSSRRDLERVVKCTRPECTGYMKGLWLAEDGKTVYFLRWTGAHRYGSMSLYLWDVGTGILREVMRTDDLIERCAKLAMKLVCARESATKPRAIVSLDLRSGNSGVLYDANPEFNRFQFGEVTARKWTDASGVEGFGHLIKPIGYTKGTRYPLIVVQYRSRGFLRGGSGDEYPIHVLASKGFAVLSFQRPENEDVFASSRSWEDVRRSRWSDFSDRRLVLSVLNAGIDRLVEEGVVDPRRVGITGYSDGGETTSFALVNSSERFAAAAVSWTYWNPILYYVGGPMEQRTLEELGFESPASEKSLERWRQISPALNSRKIRTPLLIQVADSELLPETETFANFKQSGSPIEMYVFPNEYHVRSSPLHRYNGYKRSVQWFQFWLLGVEDPEPLDPAQYARWRQLRRDEERFHRSASPSGAGSDHALSGGSQLNP